MRAQVVLVDDGSRDGTWNVIRSSHEAGGAVTVSGVRLSRNFGHQGAICAGSTTS
jgi:glycosyltransferase involved in cell wall biosynthesis